MDSRTQLKTRFSKGQRVGEADFHSLIESLAHINEDVASGELATGSSVTNLSSQIDDLKAFAESHKSDYDAYKSQHPTLGEVKDLDTQLSQAFASDIQSVSDQIETLKNKDTAIESDVSDVVSDLASQITANSQEHDIINASIADRATVSALQSAVTALEALIAAKADASHVHSDYITRAESSNFATQGDLANKADASHQHQASEISGLDEIFTTPNEVIGLINDNKIKLDERALLDDFYDKPDVDELLRIGIALAKDQILEVVDAKIDQLQESINNLTPPNPYTLYDVDPVEAEALSGVEASTVSIFATSPIAGLTLTGIFEGGVLPEVSIANSTNYNKELFIGTTSEDQVIAFNEVENQWEWIQTGSGGQKLIAVYETTDYSIVPEYWLLNPDGDFTGSPQSNFNIQVSQTSDSDLVQIFNQARFFSTGYVSQGMGYVRRVP
jgi:hypothetical protein